MKRFFLCVAVLCSLSALAARSVVAEDIGKLNLDDANSLATSIKTDADVKVEGNGSVKITAGWPTVICLGEISDIKVDNTKLVFSAKVKSENLDGAAFLEMWCDVNGGQYFSRGMDSTVSGTMDWRTISTPFLLKKGELVQNVTLNIMINGKGTLWVDDVVVSKEKE